MAETPTKLDLPPGFSIPGFEIKRLIGEGGFGQVFLALDKSVGRYRAIKVVHRNNFQSERPYQIELNGVRLFEEVSREHEGFVDILQINSENLADYFYYVMEVADALDAQPIDPARYSPRTLSGELRQRSRLVPLECVRVALALVAGLAELHRRGLVHRDVKPSNIVFVRGAPRLADVGLVTTARTEPPHTNPGDPDWIDLAVHGTQAGDLFSFGKVLYAMATGSHPRLWPELPLDCKTIPDRALFKELNSIFLKACDPDRKSRYRTAFEIQKELLALQAGASAVRLKKFELILQLMRRYAVVVLIFLVFLAAASFLGLQNLKHNAELRQRELGAFVANGDHALDSGDTLSALYWFAEAWKFEPQQSKNDHAHRLRLGSVLQSAPTLKQVWFQQRKFKDIWNGAFFTEENQVLLSTNGEQWQVFDPALPTTLYPPFGMGLPDERVSVARNPRLALTFAATNRICVWDYTRGTNVEQFEGTSIAVAALSPDGLWIAAENINGTNAQIVLWRRAQKDAASAKFLLGSAEKDLRCLVFSPDSKWLISAGEDGKACIWDVGSQRLVSTFTGHASGYEYVYNAAFNPVNDRMVVTASSDRTARIWDRCTATELGRFNHADEVFSAEFSADGKRLVTAGSDFAAHIWDVESKTKLMVLRHNARVVHACFSPTGRYLLTACFDDVIRLWSLPDPPSATPTNRWSLLNGAAPIQSNDNWSLKKASGEHMPLAGLSNQNYVAFSFAPDDGFFIATWQSDSASNSVELAGFDSETGASHGKLTAVPYGCSNLIVSANGGRIFAFGTSTGALWNSISGKRLHSFSKGSDTASFSRNGALLAVGSGHRVEVYDVGDGFARLRGEFSYTNGTVRSLEFDARGDRVISSCWDKNLYPFAAVVWDVQSRKPTEHTLPHFDGVNYAAFTHDGRRVITCGEDYIALLWDPTTGTRRAPPLVHEDQVSGAVFSQNDLLVATITSRVRRKVTVWHAETGERLTLPVLLPAEAGKDTPSTLQFIPKKLALLIRYPSGESYVLKLPYFEGSLLDLERKVGLLSPQQIDSTDSFVPQTREKLRVLWERSGRKAGI